MTDSIGSSLFTIINWLQFKTIASPHTHSHNLLKRRRLFLHKKLISANVNGGYDNDELIRFIKHFRFCVKQRKFNSVFFSFLFFSNVSKYFLNVGSISLYILYYILNSIVQNIYTPYVLHQKSCNHIKCNLSRR